MQFRVLAMTNSQIVTAYVDGRVPVCDLAQTNRCSTQRIKSILTAYGVPLRSRSQAINVAFRTKAERMQRRLERARKLITEHSGN